MAHFGSRLDVDITNFAPALGRPARIDGNVLIVSDEDYINFWDISDPSDLTLFDREAVVEGVVSDGMDVDTTNKLVFLTNTFDYLFRVYDYKTPSAVVLRDTVDSGGEAGSFNSDIAFNGNYAYIAGLRIGATNKSIGIANISDVDNLTMETAFTDATNLNSPTGVAIDVTGTYLFVAQSSHFLVYTISGNTLVYNNKVALTASPQDFRRIALTTDGNYAYVTNFFEDAIEIIDVSDPTSVSKVGTLTDATYLNGVRELQIVEDEYLYSFNFSGANFYMSVWDIGTAPTAPTRTESLDLTADAPWATGRIGGFQVDPVYLTLYVFRYIGTGTYGIASYNVTSLADRIYVYLGTRASPKLHELTDPANSGLRGVLSVHTEIGWDQELQQASSGIAQLVVDNHLGDYSPENTGGAFYNDLDLGAMITIFEVYQGFIYYHFTGYIDELTPHPEKDNQVAFILAVDGMDDMAQVEINTVLRTNTETGELAADILDAADWPAARDLGVGVDTLQLGWFHKMKALDAFRLLEKIENGRFYVNPTGRAVWENRHARLSGAGLISQHDFEDTMVEMGYVYSKNLVYSEFTVRGRRYYIGGVQLVSGYDMGTIDDQLIYSVHTGDSGAVYIPQNSTLTLWAEFGTALQSYTSLVAGTHWDANTAADKTGTDVTANVSLVQTQYGQSIKLVFTNSGNQGAYLVEPDSPPLGAPPERSVLIYGVLYSVEVMAVTEEDTANPHVTKKSLVIDAVFKSNPNDILSYAQYLKAKYKDAIPRAVSVRHVARTAWPNDTIRVQCLTRHISDRITLKSTLLGLDTDYFINKVVQDYVLGEGGMVHETTWAVERVEGNYEGVYWLLGTAGYGELGEATVLGF